jgi:hypothetical protein
MSSRGSSCRSRAGALFSYASYAAYATCAAAGVVAACTTDYQKGLDDPNYGAPNALAGEQQPPSSQDLQKGHGGEGGTTSSSGGAATPTCVVVGGMLIADAGPCAVSFKTDILGAFGASTCSMTSCHGANPPIYPPHIDPGDPAGMYTTFAGFKLSNGAPYINPCSTDPTKAGMECNLAATNGCGSHMPQGGQLDPAAITKIDTWLKCGSPNN